MYVCMYVCMHVCLKASYIYIYIEREIFMDDADFLDGAPQFCHASMPCFNGEAGAIPIEHELKNCEKLQLHL